MNNDLKRADDFLIGQLIQELKDFKEQSRAWQENHDRKSDEWRESIDKRIDPIEEVFREYATYKKGLYALGAVIVTILTLGPKAYVFIREHLK